MFHALEYLELTDTSLLAHSRLRVRKPSLSASECVLLVTTHVPVRQPAAKPAKMLNPLSTRVRSGCHRPSALVAVVSMATLTIAGCNSSSTATVTSPNPVKCQVSLATPSVIDPGGGTATFSVTTQPECAWNVSSSVGWISGLSPASGQGNGAVEFRVAPNDEASAREGNIVVNDTTVRVSQRATCRYTVNPPDQSVSTAGGEGNVAVTTASECSWTATTDVNWIRLSAPLSGSGNGSVGFSVSANAGNDRAGAVIIAGQRSIITQLAQGGNPPACTYTLSSTSQNIDATGGAGSTGLSTQAGCQWTASSNASWITVTSGASGTGNGSVGFTIAGNTGAARTGTLTIGGRTYTVTQAAPASPPAPSPPPPSPPPPTPPPPTPPPPAPSCAYTISSNNQKVDAGAGTRSVNVSTTAACSWTSISSASWITVTSGATGTGNGSVTFSYAANTGGAARTGTLTIAGQTFTLTQAGCAYSISPDEMKVDGSGESRTITVSTGSACMWTATSNDSWITITAGASGTGNGTVRFTVARNTGKKRTGTLTIAGQTAKVEQDEAKE
jgi:all-beta uncharacterized protein/BACON domain-containing protein